MADEEAKKVVLDKSDFLNWYNDVVDVSFLCDKRYPIKGMNVWTPYGWKIMQLIDTVVRRECDSTGHQEVCFPLLIPKTEFQKEADHIKGFDSEVYWVTKGGNNDLDIPLLLRPTSETAMYPIFSLWIRSHNDLPLKTYQIVNVFRYETKMTRAFMRVREIHFFEAHTCHADAEDAERQIREDCAIMDHVAKDLCLPYILLKRPDWDKFAGAVYTIGVDTLLPSGRTSQLGSIHQYHENFSKPYGIKYEGSDKQHHYAHQTTYGMSERLIGTVIGVHGDNKGLILPPKIAPYQFVIIPIPAKGKLELVMSGAKELEKELMALGYRVHLDARDVRPGSKHFDWEIKGVPVRIELGPRDLENGTLVFARRDLSSKRTVRRADLKEEAAKELSDIGRELLSRAKAILDVGIKSASTYEEAKGLLSNGWDGIIRTNWCADMDCASEIEKALDKAFLGYPLKDVTSGKVVEDNGQCIACGKPCDTVVYLGRSY